jgi:hypothetical protein
MSKIKVGLIGESPNDTNSLANLLIQSYDNRVYFRNLLKNIKGYYLDNPKVKRSLKVEFETESPKIVILIRDLDGLESEKQKIKEKLAWFDSLNKIIKNSGIFLLNIYELEALIFSDIEMFNKMYGTTLKQNKDPMFIKEPKEKLMEATARIKTNKKEYKESHSPDIFAQLRIKVVEANCTYFREFNTLFQKILN